LPKTNTPSTKANFIGQGQAATNQIKQPTPTIAATGPGIPSSVLLSVPATITAAIEHNTKGIKQLNIMVFTPFKKIN
jgi:phage tail protein X